MSIYIYIYIYMKTYVASDTQTLSCNLKCSIFIQYCRQKLTHRRKQSSLNLGEFRKLTGSLVCLCSVALQFRKVPGFRKLTGSLFGVVVSLGSWKLLEGFRKCLGRVQNVTSCKQLREQLRKQLWISRSCLP